MLGRGAGDRPRLRSVASPEDGTSPAAFDPETFDFSALDPARCPVGRAVELEGHSDVVVTRTTEPDERIITQYVGAGEPTPPTLPFTRVELANGDGPFFEESLVSPALAAKLLAWAAHFDQYYDDETRWTPSEARVRAHRETGFALERALRAELEPDIAVSVSFWDTEELGLE